jgi:hypothetical protein
VSAIACPGSRSPSRVALALVLEKTFCKPSLLSREQKRFSTFGGYPSPFTPPASGAPATGLPPVRRPCGLTPGGPGFCLPRGRLIGDPRADRGFPYPVIPCAPSPFMVTPMSPQQCPIQGGQWRLMLSRLLRCISVIPPFRQDSCRKKNSSATSRD